MIVCPVCKKKMQGTECGSGYECGYCGTLCKHSGEIVWKPSDIRIEQLRKDKKI